MLRFVSLVVASALLALSGSASFAQHHEVSLMKKSSSVIFFLIALVFAVAKTCTAQVFDEQFEHWPLDLKINGQVIVAGELDDVSTLAKLIKESDLEERVAIVTTLSSNGIRSSLTEVFSKTESRKLVSFPKTTAEIETLLNDHDVVVWHSAKPLSESVVSAVRETNTAFVNFLERGKTLVVLGGASEIVAQSFFETRRRPAISFTGAEPTSRLHIGNKF